MAYPKKSAPSKGGGGEGKEPPDELAVPKPAATNVVSPPIGEPEYCQPVCIEKIEPDAGTFKVETTGTVKIDPGGPIQVNTGPIKIDPTTPIKVDTGPIKIDPTTPVRVEHAGPVKVALQRSSADMTPDQALWVAIRHRTGAIGFAAYEDFIDRVLCGTITDQDATEQELLRLRNRRGALGKRIHFGVDAYQLLKLATEAFLILNCGIVLPAKPTAPGSNPELDRLIAREEAELGLTWEQIRERLRNYLVDEKRLPYLDRVLDGLVIPSNPFCDTVLNGGPFDPCLIELIWSYWHEEGMLVQAINAISLRFQNKRLPGGNPLSNLEISPLRPLSNLLWGYIQDEPFRLTVTRRTYEYNHQYGLGLVGKAIPPLQPADSRSKFLEAFHSLLHQAAVFYKEDADTTVIADGFPLMNGLKELHMLLAEGAHNQFGDLPWTARVEMLMQQWLLSRPELREFLRGRPMVPYKELWMGQVDTLRKMFGWGDTPVTHFRDLGAFGEQILLSIRYGDWIDVNDEDAAKNWARYWKPEIQGYVHAYRAATGIDLTTADLTKQINTTPPAVLLQRRIAQRMR